MSVSATRPVASHPRLAELALALGGFAIGTTEFVIMGLMNRIAGDLSVSPQQVGYAISSYALGVVVGAPAKRFWRCRQAFIQVKFALQNKAKSFLSGMRFPKSPGVIWSKLSMS